MCGALHILVKHQKSRRTSSWKDKEGKVSPRARQATAAVQTLRDKLAGLEGKALRAEFANVARRESDCSSAVKGGDLETFRRGAMQPPFDKAAFALKVGEMSEVIETDSGSHIILRTS
ncbi:hypothetical protein T484DRAFT_1618378 [Baffinella frigidus]|nr:hypothetical protein T484DRAFT_1618378 [Cryptophyta sp. CCMP2293]